jgi:N-acetylmuramoyl-L-alanine amidase
MSGRLIPSRRVVLVLAMAVVCASALAVLTALPGTHAPVAAPPTSEGVPVSGVTENPRSTPPQSGRPGSTQGSPGAAESVAVDPARFQPGSCVLLAPTEGDRHLTVFLDAGHGGIDPGAVGQTEAGQTVYEADLTSRSNSMRQ